MTKPDWLWALTGLTSALDQGSPAPGPQAGTCGWSVRSPAAQREVSQGTLLVFAATPTCVYASPPERHLLSERGSFGFS